MGRRSIKAQLPQKRSGTIKAAAGPGFFIFPPSSPYKGKTLFSACIEREKRSLYTGKMGKNREIELKAPVDDPEDCRVRIEAFAGTGEAFLKEDAYWFPVNPDTGNLKGGLRVRREERGELTKITVTYKTKESRGGIEVNDEREFDLAGDAAADAGGVFEELLGRLGLEKGLEKRKRGLRWSCGGPLREAGQEPGNAAPVPITLELCEVRGRKFPPSPAENSGGAGGAAAEKNLGWFLEAEILAPDDGAETVEASRQRLFEALEQAGPGREKIEGRYYSELL
jgi:adenylate cyclase class IV